MNTVDFDKTNRSALLEALLVVSIIAATALMWLGDLHNPVLLHMYYVPVVLTGFYRGVYRARMMALFSILTASTLFLPHAEVGVPIGIVLIFMLWGITLFTIAILVGTLSDDRRSAMQVLQDTHERDVLTDVLTGVSNRRAFEFELSRRQSDWVRNKTPFSLVLLDIDHFKKLNDRYGHQAGDAILVAFAKVLKNTIRDHDLVARYGGEEFGLILPRVGLEDAKEVAEQVRDLLESSRFPHKGFLLRVTASLGVAQMEVDEDVTSFVQRADAALYCSKEAGRNCVHFHDGNSCLHFGQGIATEPNANITDSNLHSKRLDVYTDETTGLPSQKVFLEEFRRRAAEKQRYNRDLAVAIITVDSLLAGSTECDARARKSLLATVARIATSVIRETDLVARYDANSLGILFPSTMIENVQMPLERLSDAVSNYQDQQYPSLSYAVSIGVVQVDAEESPGSALQRVERALSAAIVTGSHTICLHDGTTCRTFDSPDAVSDGTLSES